MISSYEPPPYEPNPDEVFVAMEAALDGNPRRTGLLGDGARPVVVEEAHLFVRTCWGLAAQTRGGVFGWVTQV